MTEFQIILTEHAVSDLKNIAEGNRNQIHDDIHFLTTTPFSFGKRIKRLKGFKPPLYRLRAGNHRIIYQIEGNDVIILRVIDRKLLIRILKRLKL